MSTKIAIAYVFTLFLNMATFAVTRSLGLINRARAQDVPVLRVQCAPENSLPFWLHMGFQFYGHAGNIEKSPLARLILTKDLPIPATGTPAHASVAFLNENALYLPTVNHRPIALYETPAVITSDNIIHLSTRCIGPEMLETTNDLVLRIVIDGRQIFLNKAKYPEAKALGVRVHSITGDYYLDRVALPPQA